MLLQTYVVIKTKKILIITIIITVDNSNND